MESKTIAEKKSYMKIYGKKYLKSHREELRLRQQTWRLKNPEKMKARKLWRRYGITIEEYDKLFDKQNGCCAICNTHQSKLNSAFHVDHNHINNKVRGLLCNKCNLAIGLLNESMLLLDKAKEYLNLAEITINPAGLTKYVRYETPLTYNIFGGKLR